MEITDEREVDVKQRAYFYCMCFSGFSIPGVIEFATTYLGLKKKEITIPDIDSARSNAKIPANACLISASYLGYMTADELTGKVPLEPRIYPS